MSEGRFSRTKKCVHLKKKKAKRSHLIGFLIMVIEMIYGEPSREAYKRISKSTTTFVTASD